MAYAPDIHVAVYQVLDDLIRATVPPPGAKATIHSVVDDLKTAAAPNYMIAHAENISLQLHHIECAVASGDADRASNARQQLRQIAARWLDQRIKH